MRYATILVHLDCGRRSRERIDVAARFAEEFDARLIGLFALDLYAGMRPVADAGSILVEAELKRREGCRAEARAEFTRRTAAWAARAQWSSSDDDAAEEVALAARNADLVVIGQIDPATFKEDGISASFADGVVLTAGKPVLLVPRTGHFEAVGRHTLVAWNPVREADRALMDSLPVLERSLVVDVVSFCEPAQPDEQQGVAGALQSYLQGYGINATLKRYATDHQSPGEHRSPGELILSHAGQETADCIVMGAHAQTRRQEPLLGGTTAAVMKATTVPLLLSR